MNWRMDSGNDLMEKWPHCPVCGDFALDGHITCGRVQCDEGRQRQLKTEAWRKLNITKTKGEA